MEHIYNNSNFGENWFEYPKLYSFFVSSLPDNSSIVEVGCWKGKSTAYLSVEIINSKKDIKLYAVDTWLGSEEHKNDHFIKTNTLYDVFMENIKPVMSVVTPIRKPSVEASKQFEDESLDVVFIDACHSYECVSEDIKSWLPKVKKNGYLAGHDYGWTGVEKAVNELLGNNVTSQEGCWIYKK